MWANLTRNARSFDNDEMLILKKALAAYKRELEEVGIAEVSREISRVDSLQLRFIGIKDDSNP